MVLSNFILSLFLIAIYSYNVNCQLDLDTNSLGEDANLTFVYINSNSALRLFPFASLSISNIVADSVGVTVSTEGVQTQKPILNTAQSLLQNIYYENSDIRRRSEVYTPPKEKRVKLSPLRNETGLRSWLYTGAYSYPSLKEMTGLSLFSK